MYSEAEGTRKTMGDVDVFYHEGVYHLFHLVLPNHDFIAHAVSDDGLTWSRVENALFIGHPGAWDDSMLWTMHVSKDPHQPGQFRMFYTGIAQHDNGLVQRIGLATSPDLYAWTKSPVNWLSRCERCQLKNLPASNQTALYDESSRFPLEAQAPHYEHELGQGRNWISWRDPFYVQDGDDGWLLIAGRVPTGPITRRGCVAVMKEVSPNCFEHQPPLYYPTLYDDIEVPNVLKLDGQYYLIGSLREDVKIRYWYTTDIGKAWLNYSDNVLLPKGNYAGRICYDDKGALIWNFFSHDVNNRQVKNLLPPPKRLVRDQEGKIRVEQFEGFDSRVEKRLTFAELGTLSRLIEEADGKIETDQEHRGWRLNSEVGFQGFMLEPALHCFRMNATIQLSGTGKCGLFFRVNAKTHDGYYLSLDLIKGVAQLRSWGTNFEATGDQMMKFQSLQAGYWKSDFTKPSEITLLVYGDYIEFSINGGVLISLADQNYRHGRVGVYIESACIDVTNVHVESLHNDQWSNEGLTKG
jgi:beta-fructofuranosidase